MAAAVRLSEATVRRIWHKHGLKPHLMKTFKVSTDPHFQRSSVLLAMVRLVCALLNRPGTTSINSPTGVNRRQSLHRTSQTFLTFPETEPRPV